MTSLTKFNQPIIKFSVSLKPSLGSYTKAVFMIIQTYVMMDLRELKEMTGMSTGELNRQHLMSNVWIPEILLA